ncbi:MAG TPA: hypothetical protein VLX33_03130 [Nitrososphaerales archaeon]|nr:hypothetical protein [Nitrososphaerales archaeon]
MVGKGMNPVGWIVSHIPRSRGDAEATARSLLKLAFWVVLLAPVIILPAYYLLVVVGVAPPIHLPPG